MPEEARGAQEPRTPRGPELTRRRLIGGAAVGAAAAASLALPSNLRKALDWTQQPPRNGSVRDIEHVVLMMQENRSFDHYFGTFSGVRGFSDPTAMKLRGGNSVFYQPDPTNPDGYLLPYHLDSLTTAAQAIPSTSHLWQVQHQCWNNDLMDDWVPAHIASDGSNVGPYTMGYFEEADIPFQRALAAAFTICDNYHCSVMGPTHPNRYMWLTGTIDPNGQYGGPALDDRVKDGTYFWSTYAERLTEAGVSWRCYQEPDNYDTNVLEFFRQYRSAPASSPLYQNAMVSYPAGKFEHDAVNGNLPTVSWIFPTGKQSEHPAYLPAAGAAFVASKIDAIAANPDVWAKTVFLLVYDENDGLFDHVVPPTPPAGTADEFVTLTSPGGTSGNGLPVGLGFRVPNIIVSPWTAGGWVCSDVFDHTSHLLFLEAVTGVEAPNISAWRRQTVGDLTSALRFSQRPSQAPVLPETSGPLTLAEHGVEKFRLPSFPGASQTPPAQQPGRRPHTR
jgi:phospholipase C